MRDVQHQTTTITDHRRKPRIIVEHISRQISYGHAGNGQIVGRKQLEIP